MKLERSKNAGKNIAFELFRNLYGIFIPFVQRTVMIIYLGMEYTGLGGLFSSILSVLSLAELGVGSAMVYSMYQPIAEDDEEKICKLLNLYKKYYRIIGTVILTLGLAITPFLKHLIKNGEYPKDINIYILFLMTLTNTVLSYWLFAYKNSVLSAYQKNYYSIQADMETAIIFDGLQIVSLVFFRNYYLYLGCGIVRQILTNVIRAHKVNKYFPQFRKPKGKLEKREEKAIRSNIKDIFTNKLGNVLSNAFDTIVTSGFLGLTVLAQYQNYTYIWGAVMGLAGIVFNATRAGIGNSLVSESEEKNFKDLKTFTFIIFWIVTICSVGFTNLYQPFIEVWVGRKNVLGFGIVVCLVLFCMTRMINYLFSTYKEAAGIWHKDRYRPIISGVVNLAFNLITVRFWGLYGVVLSTVISEIFVDIPWLIYNVFSTVFAHSNKREYLQVFLKYIANSAIITIIVYMICSQINLDGVINIIVLLLVSMLLCNAFMVLIYIKTSEFGESIRILKRMLK